MKKGGVSVEKHYDYSAEFHMVTVWSHCNVARLIESGACPRISPIRPALGMVLVGDSSV